MPRDFEREWLDRQAFGISCYRMTEDDAETISPLDIFMTTDPEEGRRQIEAMQPPKLKVGDKVRLSAGGERFMIVVALEDYGNNAVCEWSNAYRSAPDERETFPARSLVRVEPDKQSG